MSTAKFSLKDCRGVEHTYEVARNSVAENAALQLMLGAPLIDAVSNAISTIVPILQDEEVREQLASSMPQTEATDGMVQGNLSFAAIAKALARANWVTFADILKPLPAMIITQGGPDLVTRIFAKTDRLLPIEALQGQPSAGESVVDPNVRQHLGAAAGQDQAFGEGNMGEYWKAAVMVLVANFTPSGPDGSISWKGAVNALTGGMFAL